MSKTPHAPGGRDAGAGGTSGALQDSPLPDTRSHLIVKSDPVQLPLVPALERIRAAMQSPRPSLARGLVILAVAAAYFASARLGLRFAMPGGNVTPVWPPSGLALAAVLLFGSRVWPGVWLGSFAANFWGLYYTAGGVSLAPALTFATGAGAGAALTAWLGAVLTQRLAGTGNPIERVRDICALMGLGGVTACLLSASNGVLWLSAAGLAPWGERGSIWLTWWLGDTAGVFIFAPLLLAWCLAPSFPRRRRWAEAAACFALLLVACSIMFDGALLPTLSAEHFAFLIVPFLVWPALRLGQRGAATATLVVACLAVWGAIHGKGPFVLATRNESLLLLELFLSVVALSGLCVAAVATGLSRAEAERRIVLDELESCVRERTAALVAEITERQRAEEKLGEREAHLRAIVDSEPECVKLLSADGTLLEMNPAGLAMIEADSIDQVRGAKMARLLVPAYREPFAKLTRRVFGGLPGGLEFEITGLKGGRRWVETHAVPLRGADGKIQALLGITRDTTARRQAEDALRRERDFSATVIDSLPGVFYLVDPRWRLRRWNRNFETVTGYTAAELGSMDAGGLFSPAELPRVQESFLKVFETGSGDVETELVPREGPPVPYYFTGMRAMLGNTPCMAGVGIDVSERRRSAALIEGQKQVLELIAKGAPLTESLTALLRVIEAQSPEMLCSILLLDPDGVHVRHGAAPSLPQEFNEAIAGQPIGPGAGSCGTAAFRREPVFVEDIATDPLWAQYRAATLPHGLRACWSTPIFDGKRSVLGTFAIYYRKPGLPTARHLRYIDLATGLASIAISRKRGEAALEKMRFSVDRAGDGVFWVSPEGRVLYVNSSACERLGYSHEEMLGMTIFDLDPDYHPGVWSAHWEELKRSGTRTLETRQRCRDGRILSVEVNANFVLFDGNEFIFCFVRDITARKEAEEAVRENEEKFSKAFQNSPDAVLLTTLDGKILEANAGFTRLTGYAFEEAQGRTTAELHFWADAPDRERFISALHTHGRVMELEAPFLTRTGERRICLISGELMDLGGKPAIVGVVRDITDRKAAEAALREREERLRVALSASGTGTFRWDICTGEMSYDKALDGLFGLFRGQTFQSLENFLDAVHPEDRAGVVERCERCARDGADLDMEFRVLWPDGSLHWLDDRGKTFFDAAGKPLYMTGACVDITDRKRDEAAMHDLIRRLMRAEDAERRRIAKELHDSTAQDLVAVLMNLGMLRDALTERDGKPAQLLEDSVALVENSANDIRTLSYVLHPPRLDEMGLAGALTEYAAGLGMRADVRIRVEAAADFGRLPEELELVFFRVAQESLANAVRHSHSDSATIRLARAGGGVVLEIEDYGCGMPLRSAAQPVAYGVGITGMRERVQHLGGRLEIESGGLGTIVRAVLPWKGEPR